MLMRLLGIAPPRTTLRTMHSLETIHRLNEEAVEKARTLRSYRIYLGRNRLDRTGADSLIPRHEAYTGARQALEELSIDGATFHDAAGMWQGTDEPTLIVEIWAASDRPALRLAGLLRTRFEQDAVGIVNPDGTVLLSV